MVGLCPQQHHESNSLRVLFCCFCLCLPSPICHKLRAVSLLNKLTFILPARCLAVSCCCCCCVYNVYHTKD